MGRTAEGNVESPDWGTAVVVDPKELRRLKEDSRRLQSRQSRRTVAAMLLLGVSALSAPVAYWQHSSVSKLRVKIRECRQNAMRPNGPSCRASLEPEMLPAGGDPVCSTARDLEPS